MPITAEEVIGIIEIAYESVQLHNKSLLLFQNISDDVENLRIAVWDGATDEMKDLILNISTMARAGQRNQLDEKGRENLYRERERFRLNYNKNNKRRVMRQLQRRHQRIIKDETIGRGVRPMTDVEMYADGVAHEEYLKSLENKQELKLLAPEPEDQNPIPNGETGGETDGKTEIPQEWERYENFSLKKPPKTED